MAILSRCLAAATILAAPAAPAHAQLIRVRTAPIAVFDQFDVFPSANHAMGGASIALRDTLRDPFMNPAMGARSAGWFWSSPSVVSHSRNAGGGRSLPLGATFRFGGWFGGVSGAMQQIEPGRSPVTPDAFFAPTVDVLPGPFLPQGRQERSDGTNTYGFLSLGRRLGSVAVGASITRARLEAVDGVDLMYLAAQQITQRGRITDLRLGFLAEMRGGATMQAVLLRHSYRLTHDVTWLDPAWDPATQSFIGVERPEANRDRTDTWGAHLAYDLPLILGWRIGATATVNRMEHPQLPAYELSTIPRDPGRSWAWNLGVGLARRNGPASFAVDALIEPVRTHTWSSTTDSRFSFRNLHLKLGAGRDFAVDGRGNGGAVQLGLAVRSVDYRLARRELATNVVRTDRESWVEWAPSWGLAFRFPEIELRYRGTAVNGTGRPAGFFNGPVPLFERATTFGPNVLAAPGALTLDNVAVVTHQFSIAVPLR